MFVVINKFLTQPITMKTEAKCGVSKKRLKGERNKDYGKRL